MIGGEEKAGEMVSEYAGGRTIGATTGTLTPPPPPTPPIALPADSLCGLKALSPPPLEPELKPVEACKEVEVEEGFAFFALYRNCRKMVKVAERKSIKLPVG